MACVIADAGNSIMSSHRLPHLMLQSVFDTLSPQSAPYVLFNNPS